jgi:hypothetical protein
MKLETISVAFQSASELCRLRDRRWAAHFSAKFADRGVLRGQRGGSTRPLISVFKTGVATFSFK